MLACYGYVNVPSVKNQLLVLIVADCLFDAQLTLTFKEKDTTVAISELFLFCSGFFLSFSSSHVASVQTVEGKQQYNVHKGLKPDSQSLILVCTNS